VPVKVARAAGDVALDQMRAVDKARLAKRVGALSAAEAKAVLGRVGEMFGE
jgi:mRNA-degrading endonuclease toxin of MazEF toxin-antitoxin module